MNEQPECVLMVGLNWIGDTIMSMPAVQAWRLASPRARLVLLVKRGLADLWALHRAPDEVWTYEEGLAATWQAARMVREGGFQEAIVLPHSFRSAAIPFLGHVPERRGLPGHVRDFLLTRVVRPRLGEGRRHQVFEYHDLLMPDGAARVPGRPELALPPEAVAQARMRVTGLPRPLLGVLPGAARGPAKRWPAEHFAAVARRWIAERRGSVLLMGGADDAATCAPLAASLGGSALDLAGRTTLAEWAAYLKACDAVVANDSGGMHLAAAVGTPVAAVFGMTDPERTGPLGGRCRIVQDAGPRSRDLARASAEAQKRLAAISPERVYEAVLSLG